MYHPQRVRALVPGLWPVLASYEARQSGQVEQKKIVANRLLAQVGQETALLDEQRAVLLDDEKKQLELSENLNELQAQLKARVDLAAPLLEKAEVKKNPRTPTRAPRTLNPLRTGRGARDVRL